MVFPKPHEKTKECPTCEGTGWEMVRGFVGATPFPCKVCGQTGRVKEYPL